MTEGMPHWRDMLDTSNYGYNYAGELEVFRPDILHNLCRGNTTIRPAGQNVMLKCRYLHHHNPYLR